MGVSCIRFKKLDDLPLDVIGEAVRRLPLKKFIAEYEKTLVMITDAKAARKAAKAKPAAAKTAKKPAAAKKPAKSKKT
jgi:hypothetical protein